MITVTFDAIALFVGFFIGMLVGALLTLFIEMREGGPWSDGYATGYRSGTELRKYIEDSVRSELTKAAKGDK